ncbi:nucleoid occlusion protein [Deinococcus carri]|uniref:Nucleoid occlusion protein n=1 Tax=Deinococcus carri TaxID=1211323 RepID=A0ABP9W9M5_9DEIO
MSALAPTVQDALSAATLSEDGLALTLADQLDRATYQATAKALQALGGKWDRKAKAHLFQSDVRQVLAGVLDGDKLPKRNPLAYFPTPEPVIAEMVKRIWPWPNGSRFLEPSAGEGAIADDLWNRHGVYPDCIELDEDRAQVIRKKGYRVVGRDFLAFTPETPYDYVLMNPPFTVDGDTQTYITHIEHALKCLRPGGELVAVVPGGFAWLSRKRVAAFREFCEQHAQSPLHEFAPDTFKASGTSVATCLIHIAKPEEAAMPAPAEQPKKPRKSSKKATASTGAAAAAAQQEATCRVTGETFRVGEWVEYQIDGETMRGQIAEVDQQEVPFKGIAMVPNHKAGRLWIRTLQELRRVDVSEGAVEAAIAPAVAAPDFQLGDDVRVRTGRPDLAVITGLKATDAQLLYADNTRLWVPITALEKATTWAQPEPEQARDEVSAEWLTQLEEWRTQFPVGARVRFQAASGVEPGAVEEFPGVVVSHEPGNSECCTVEDDGHSTVVKFRNLTLLDGPVAEMSEPVANEATAAPTPAELPGTPVLLPEQPALSPAVMSILADSTSNVFRLHELVPSPLNPRKVFEQSALEELAESIAHKGLMQNLVGRVTENRRDVEIVAGGRRLRALKLLAEQGRIPADYPVPVRVQPLSDLEALQLATAENVERRNMTPIEEADAFAQMVALGATPEDIALRFGYSGRTVAQRLVLAEGLGEDGRKLFADGKIGLGQAQVIAQAGGPLRKHVLEAAKRGDGVSSLHHLIKRGSFLVEYAKFDVAASGLEIVEDLYGDQPARFADPKAALARQMDWVKAREKELGGKKEQRFVDVMRVDRDHFPYYLENYADRSDLKELCGTLILISTVTGEVSERRRVRPADLKSHEAKQRAAERKETAAEATGSEGGAIRKSGWVDGHAARAAALRTALLGDHKRAVALTILTLLSAHASAISVNWQNVEGVELPEVRARLLELDEKLGGNLKPSAKPVSGQPLLGSRWAGMWNRSDAPEYEFLSQLLTLSLEDLLDLQGILIAQAYGNWDKYSPEKPAREFPTRLAADVRAVVKFRLTDDHLKAYTRDRLLDLAADAGLGYIAQNVANFSTNKDIRAAILEYADELATRGYVPPIARFPELSGPNPDDVQYREDAKALVLRLSDVQAGELLEDLGYDPTAENAAASNLQFVRQEIDAMDIEELRGWEALKRLAQELAPEQAAAD